MFQVPGAAWYRHLRCTCTLYFPLRHIEAAVVRTQAGDNTGL